jgi:hypothetical protein
MKIQCFQLSAPPPEIVMTFTRDEGWALMAALYEWTEKHPLAADVAQWRQWHEDLRKLLRESCS